MCAREDEELAVASNLVSGDGPEVLQAERAPWRLLVGRCEDLDAGQRDGLVLGHCGMNGIVDEIIAENQDAVLGLGGRPDGDAEREQDHPPQNGSPWTVPWTLHPPSAPIQRFNGFPARPPNFQEFYAQTYLSNRVGLGAGAGAD